jgi:protein TonB
MAAFYAFVSQTIRYPAQARRMGIEGKVFVEFVVEKDGSLSSFTVVKGIGAGCDEEAIRVLQMSPPWTPGKQRGQAVKQRMVLPIYFKMAQRVS